MKLRECPFCAATDYDVRLVSFGNLFTSSVFHVECARCGAKGPTAPMPEFAVSAWNKRRRVVTCHRTPQAECETA